MEKQVYEGDKIALLPCSAGEDIPFTNSLAQASPTYKAQKKVCHVWNNPPGTPETFINLKKERTYLAAEVFFGAAFFLYFSTSF